MRLIVLLFLFNVFPPFYLFGQGIAFENLTVDDGLSQNSVLAIVQDNRGFMWYGTQHGLNKYDTRTFKIYQHNPADRSSISSDYITALLMDSHQRLWVGTRGGLNKYDPEKDSFERIKLENAGQGTSNEIISSIYEDKQANVWVWSSNGLRLLANKTSRFTAIAMPDSVAGLSGTNIRRLFEDHAGEYWIGSSAGLTKMVKSGGRFIYKKYKHNPEGANSLSDNYVTAITEDAQNNLWVGTLHGGINRFNRSSNSFARFLDNSGIKGPVNNNIRVLIPDKTGKIWIGTQGGLSIVDPLTGYFTSYTHDPENKNSLAQNSIYSIFIDRAGTVWIGTYWAGINMVSSHNTAFQTYQAGRYHSIINNNVVGSVIEDHRHNLWIGTEGSGLNYFDRKADAVVTYKNKVNDASSIGSDLVKVIYIDKDKQVWVGTHGGGLNLFNPVTHNFKRFLYKENDPVTLGSEILCILEDSKNNFWVGTQSGLLVFRRNKSELETVNNTIIDKIGKKSIKAILEDEHQNLWIGTWNGLYLYNHDSGSIKVYTTARGLGSNDINCIYLDSRNRVWVGLYYGGLAGYNSRTDNFISYSESNGLANSNVVSILEDSDNKLWMGTGDGLSRFNIGAKTFKNYSKNDGLGGNTFNINSRCKTYDGEMIFGGFNGLSSFFPSKIGDNNIAPPVVITSLKLFNKAVAINQPDKLLSEDISLTKKLTFSHSQNVFTIDFAALNYIKSEKNKYAYKLKGFDRDWLHTTIPSASYTNLSPGNYTFFAKGSNNDGVWGQPAELDIRILPSFWQTTWAYSLYLLFVSGLIFLIARYFILRSLLRRDHELTQLKLNFFTNISHEIRTHLSLIAGPVEKLLLSSKADDENTKQLQIVKKKSDSLLQLVNELMDFRKAETGNLKLHPVEDNVVTALREIFDSFCDLAASRNIEISFSTVADEIRLYYDREQLEKVFNNLIYNAFKFTGSGGFIHLSITENKNEVVVIITDSGKGIAPENLKNLFENYFQENDHGQQNTGYGIGLALAKSITELHGGTIEADSKLSPDGNKTFFTVTLPKGSNYFSKPDLNRYHTGYFSAAKKTFDIAEEFGQPIATVHKSKNKKHVILLIEDNADVRRFISETLEDSYDVIESVNGASGWECAVEHIPDLIISDVMMPEMDGFTLCSKLKEDERTSHIPIILLTAKSSTPSHINGLKMGANVYLTKPFSIQVLLLQVENLLVAREKIRDHYNRQLKTNDIDTVFAPALHLHETDELQSLINSVDNEFLSKVIKIIEDQFSNEDFGVPFLAKAVAMSQPVLYKKINAVTGMSVNDFIKSVKMNRATTLLQSKRYTINEIAYMLGFSDRKYFSKEFKRLYGKTPSEFVK